MTDVTKESALIDKSNQPKNLEISAYRKQAFYRFGGDATEVRFKADKDTAEVIFDQFGEDTVMAACANDKIQFTAKGVNKQVFFGWRCSFGNRLKVVAPKERKARLADYLQELKNEYTRKP